MIIKVNSYSTRNFIENFSLRKTVTGPIEYQKEMDTDKESSKGTLEKKKDKNKVC